MKRRVFCTLVTSTLAMGLLPGCKNVESVKEWIVKVATTTGEWIEEKAENLYTAIRNVFFKIKIEDGVKFERDNPLVGIVVEDRDLSIKRDDLGIDVVVHLKGKKVKRATEMDPWMIDRDALPESVRKFWDIATA